MKELDYKDILKKAPFGYALYKVLLNKDGNINDLEYIEINDVFEKITGLYKNKVVEKKVTEIFPDIKNEKFDWIEKLGNVALNNSESEFEQYSEELKTWYKVKLYSPKKYYVVTYLVDITNEVKEKELFKSMLLSINEGIIATDLEGRIIIINKTAERITQWKKDDILTKKIFDTFKVYDEQGENKITENVLNIINNGEIINQEEMSMLKTKNEIDIPIVYNISPIKDGNILGKISGMVITFKDITEKIIKDKELDYITFHDGLTGVYNRNFFNEEIINIDLEKNLPISVIMGDVNGLKLTNDAFGHLIGDKLLVSASNIMKRVCRDNDIVVRWGGDEFIILLPKTEEKEVKEISERIKNECIKENIEMINISISLGYGTKKAIDEDIMKSITKAEEMMYKIKMLESKSVKSRTLKIIINTLYEKSKQDDAHSKNVSKICKLMGETMNMTEEKISELEILGDIHDIGKIGISESILNKEGKLNSEEWEEVKKHPQIGYHIVSSSSDLAFLVDCVLFHHEWYDGSGYPKGLKGEEIPLMARIVSIADAYDAMTSYRPYKKSHTKNEALEEIIKYSGTQFDPELVKIFTNSVIKRD